MTRSAASRSVRIAACTAALASFLSVPARAGDGEPTIGVFADSLGTQSCTTLAPGSFTTLYVIASATGPVADGIAGAEFRLVVSNPTGYLISYISPPDTPIVIGTPLDLEPDNDNGVQGVVMGFPACRVGPRVSLGKLQVFNLAGGSTEIRVQRRLPSGNNDWVCPLVVSCGPAGAKDLFEGLERKAAALADPQVDVLSDFDKYCLATCDFDAHGSPIASRFGLNVSDCGPLAACPATCPGAPCAQIVQHTVSSPRCVGQPVTVTATVANCGDEASDLDVFIEGVLAASFDDVAPGANVFASRTYPLTECGNLGSRIAVGVVATNKECPQPVGFEDQFVDNCTETCNRPPDCSNAQLTVTSLWPPDGRLVATEVVGFTDPDGDPLNVAAIIVASDEAAGIEGSAACPDAILDGGARLRLRAERNSTGDGRIYRIHANISDSSSEICQAVLDVCVPRKAGGTCPPAPNYWQTPTTCTVPTAPDNARPGPAPTVQAIVIAIPTAQGADVRFEQVTASQAQIDIYDIRGRRMARLASGRFAAGRHVLRWDGRDERGTAVANGIYVVHVVAGETTASAKIAIVR